IRRWRSAATLWDVCHDMGTPGRLRKRRHPSPAPVTTSEATRTSSTASGYRSGAASHPRALAASDELRRHLAAGLVDHLVPEHDRALALTRAALGRRLLVGVEDVPRMVEL